MAPVTPTRNPDMDSYCTDPHCRDTGDRHLHPPYAARPSLEQRVADLEHQLGIAAAEIVKLWNHVHTDH